MPDIVVEVAMRAACVSGSLELLCATSPIVHCYGNKVFKLNIKIKAVL